MSAKSFSKREEISQALMSGRMKRMFTTSAQLYRHEDDQWKELTTTPIYIHLFHDVLEDVTKMLALDENHRLIINNVPLSSNFTISSSNKLFLHFISNKFDKNCDVYGFGFKHPYELEKFFNKLNEIRTSAIASLTPSFHPPGGSSSAVSFSLFSSPSSYSPLFPGGTNNFGGIGMGRDTFGATNSLSGSLSPIVGGVTTPSAASPFVTPHKSTSSFFCDEQH